MFILVFSMINATGFKSIDILDNRNYEPFTWMIQKVFIAHEPYYFTEVEELKSYFLFIALIRDEYPYTTLTRDKYPLHNINGDENMIKL